MDRTDRAFEAITEGMTDWADVVTGKLDPKPAQLRRRHRLRIIASDIAANIAGALGVAAVLLVLAGLLGGFAYVARLGWELAG